MYRLRRAPLAQGSVLPSTYSCVVKTMLIVNTAVALLIPYETTCEHVSTSITPSSTLCRMDPQADSASTGVCCAVMALTVGVLCSFGSSAIGAEPDAQPRSEASKSQ